MDWSILKEISIIQKIIQEKSVTEETEKFKLSNEISLYNDVNVESKKSTNTVKHIKGVDGSGGEEEYEWEEDEIKIQTKNLKVCNTALLFNK